MEEKKATDRMPKLALPAVISFFLTLVLCSTLIGITILNRNNVERLEMEQLISEKSVKIAEVITKLLYKTEALSALVVQGSGEIENFEKVATTLIDDPAILNVLVAPGGVVSDVYPLKGNEAVIGLDFFSEGAGNAEAILAKEKGQLVFGGPFNLVQGGQALVGRLPVFTEPADGVKEFWGIVSVTLKYPDVLDLVGLDSLGRQGYSYEIWRVNPDDGERQIITENSIPQNENSRFIEKPIPLLNANWHFRVSPVRNWYQYTETWILVFGTMFISFLIAFVIQNNYELKLMQSKIEHMAQTDSLTEIYNKRYFMIAAESHVARSQRLNSDCFIIMMDVDYFKNVNDTYGHLVGDELLKEIAFRIKSTVRPYDLFARFGGEEFIILIPDANEEASEMLAERLRIKICEKPFDNNGMPIDITASFGVAQLSPKYNLSESIKHADDALYEAKAQGRDRVVFHSPE